MAKRLARISIVVLLLAALILPPPVVDACGPYFPEPAFTDYNFPDAPLESYARGKLGLIQPGYRRVFLYVAYRNLIGKPFSSDEIAAMKSSWDEAPGESAPENASSNSPGVNWIDSWKAARNQALGDSSKSEFGYSSDQGIYRSIRSGDQFYGYYNCLPGAFQNAVQVLARRIEQFGAQSPYVKEWVSAQDQVFENCPGGTGGRMSAVIPAAASENAPESIRQDRAYQIAAAQFYAGNFEQAKAGFDAIANDPASSYHTIAPYLVARALVREGNSGAGSDDVNHAALAQAEKQLQNILSDKDLKEIHHAAQRLLGFVRIRLHPEEREKELEAILLSGNAGPDFGQDLTDFLWLLDRPVQPQLNPVSSAPTAPGQAQTAKPSGPSSGSDMADWILTFQQSSDEAFQHSQSRWKETNSLPWLVAAISHAQSNDSAAKQLEAAALKVAPDSPAYLTVTFHRLRLLSEAGRTDDARSGLDRALASKSPSLTPSARNEFLALRMKLSTNLKELLLYAPRIPANMGVFSEYFKKQSLQQSLFDSDASVVLTEKLPLRLLAEAAQAKTLPLHLRKQVAIAAWTRAILLNDEPVARELTPVLAEVAPELKTPLDEYASAKSTGEKGFAATFLLLRFPGLRPFVPAGLPRSSYEGPEQLKEIDSYRNNWWCLIGLEAKDAAWHTWNFYTMYTKLSQPLREIYPDGKIPSPSFLTESEQATLGNEWATFQSLPSAPTWLAQQSLAWAKSHPEDPRVPEALHHVVRATHLGCLDPESGRYSKQAFTLLHSRYPNSEWAKRTPYWFK
jgi:tetratricopeptide (TPR) repeat protein